MTYDLPCFSFNVFDRFFSTTNTETSSIVRIESTYNGFIINGTGYIVRIGEKNYVRTASHVTIGGKATIKIYSGTKELKKYNAHWATHNSYDDQLIEISDSDIIPLASYDARSQSYLVNPTIDLNKLKIQKIEKNIKSAFFIIPSHSNRETQNFKSLRFDHLSSSFNDRELKIATGRSNIISDIKLNPGESGSPVIGFARCTYFEQIDCTKYPENFIPILIGHASSYSIEYPISSFMFYDKHQELVAFLNPNNYGKDHSHVEWNYQNGVFYRTVNKNGIIINEANFVHTDNLIENFSGDGTSASGGDGELVYS